MSRKAQGLPINTVVLAGLAVLVLLLIAMFVTGGASKIFGGIARIITGGQAGMSVQLATQQCENAYDAWVNSGCSPAVGKSYCCMKFEWIDVDGDGVGDPRKAADPGDVYNATCDSNSGLGAPWTNNALVGSRKCGNITCSDVSC